MPTLAHLVACVATAVGVHGADTTHSLVPPTQHLSNLAQNKSAPLPSVQHGANSSNKPFRREPSAAQNISTVLASTSPHGKSAAPVCVSLHLFNSAPIISELFTYMNNLPAPFEVIAHLDVQSRDFSMEKDFLAEKYPDATLITTEDNRGADVGGKLLTIQDLLLRSPDNRCKTMLFIHSKSADWWRRLLLDPLVGSVDIASKNLQLLNSKPEIGMLGSAGCRVDELAKRDFHTGGFQSNVGSPEHHLWMTNWINDHMGCNFPWVQEYSRRLGMRVPQTWKEIDFVAGSVFWVKTDILMKAFETKNEADDPLHMYMELERNYDHQDCQRAHGFERFFGWIVTASQHHIEWL